MEPIMVVWWTRQFISLIHDRITELCSLVYYRCGRRQWKQGLRLQIWCGKLFFLMGGIWLSCNLIRPGPPKTSSGTSSTYFVPWAVRYRCYVLILRMTHGYSFLGQSPIKGEARPAHGLDWPTFWPKTSVADGFVSILYTEVTFRYVIASDNM